MAVVFGPDAQAIDHFWAGEPPSKPLYSQTGLPLTITASDRLFASGKAFKKYFDGTVFTNNGILEQSDDTLYFIQGPNVTNAGTWNLLGDIGFQPGGSGSGGNLTNAGTLAKTAGNGLSVIFKGVEFSNSGTLDAQIGTMEYRTANPTFNNGTVFAGTGKHLLTDGATFNSNFAFNNNLEFRAGTFNAAVPGGITLNSDLLWTGGTLTGNSWTNETGHTLTASGTAQKFVKSTTFTNNGIVNLSDDPLELNTGASVINAGTWNLQGDVGFQTGSGNTITNSGTLAKTSGSGISTIGTGMAFNNTGLVDVKTGTINVQTNFTNQGTINVEAGTTFAVNVFPTFINGSSGLLQGNGTYDPFGGNDLINQGTIAPGKDGIGTLTIAGDLTQTAGGLLDFEIGGVTSNLDTLNITGNASFSGTLKVESFGGFTPQVGDIFTLILFGGTRTGTFATVDSSAFSGLNFSAIYNEHDVQLKVVSAVPLPAAFWLFGSALPGMIACRRRPRIAESSERVA